MGIGGYRASKDEMGWNGDWPRIYSSPPNDKLQSFHPLQPRKDRGGCCTQKSVSRDSSVEATSAASTSIPAPHGALNNPPARSHPSRNESSKRQVTPSAGDTLYKIPSGYGTLKQPLTEEQLGRLRQDGRLLAQTVPVYATDDGILDGEVITASGTDHFCRCGPGCQCRACVAHPYNETTREFVQSMGEVMSADFEQGAGMGDVCSTHKTRPQSSGQPLEIYDMAAPTTQSFNYNRSLEQSREPLHLSASPPFSGLESQKSPISPPESQTGLESLQQSHTESDISNINTSGINTYIPINLPQIIAKSRGRDDLVQSNYFANDSLGLDKFHPEYAPIASVYQNTYGTSYH
ncbi:MAG: hypothetical protein M1827_004434 [Pycnora praestabilis]|nr:MAG: hypothetical protein M1827_004434 [Pycnora praestabilis]